MKRAAGIACWVFAGSVLLALPCVRAAEPSKDEIGAKRPQSQAEKNLPEAKAPAPESRREKPGADTSLAVFKPPLRGAPVGRIAGGTRGDSGELPLLCVLTPDRTGLTIHDQPALYWFLSQSISYPLELTVIDDHSVEPLLERRIPNPKHLGFQIARLADFNLHLESGAVYRWYIAIVPDPDRRSRDLVAWGQIERVDPPEGLAERLRQAGPDGVAGVYAESGLWYDALDAVGRRIGESTDPAPYLRQRAALLEQVGLSEVASYGLARQ